ncbi:vWA domain-containing protein [Deinococcus sonorensis]|uniref:VWA domain-containing protein n=1 Tax=Deinococcus sonorensis TaxID=309891 RepID=A0ABV8YAT0_9DEIO
MLTLPRQKSTPDWSQAPQWRRWLTQLFRYYSWRGHYHLQIDPALPAPAAVLPERRLLLLHPDLERFLTVSVGVRGLPVEAHARRVALLQALCAHEAGHLRYTDTRAWPTEATLAHLVNCLEDQRIEWRMAQRHPELWTLFTMLGDVMAVQARQSGHAGTAHEGCLLWRWEHDQLQPAWAPRADQAELWADVRPLVEASWLARDTTQVAWIARCIVELMRSDQEWQQAEQADEQARASAPEGDDTEEAPSGGADAGADASAPGDRPLSEADPNHVDHHRHLPALTGAASGDPDGQPSAEAGEATAATETPAPGVDRRDVPRPPDAPLELPPPVDVEGLARQVAPLLRPLERPAAPTAHRTRGRLSSRHVLQGSERPFRRPGAAGREAALHLTVLLDESGSMLGEPTVLARQAARLVMRAAELSRSRAQVIAFDTEAVPVGRPGPYRDFEAALLAHAPLSGNTCLEPALRMALDARPGLEEVPAVVIITDGELERSDLAACRALLRAHPHVRVVPLLIGDAVEQAATYRAVFPDAVVVPDLSQLTLRLCAVLRHWRQTMRRPRA